jgi:hypothetical protein
MRNQIVTRQNLLGRKRPKKIFCSGKVIGTFDGTVFTKKVSRSKHLFRNLDAWGNDEGILLDLLTHGCQSVRLVVRETGQILEASLQTIFSRGVKKDLGWGPQLFLPEKFWSITDAAQGRLF